MSFTNQLELGVAIDVSGAKGELAGLNSTLNVFEREAVAAGRGASEGFGHSGAAATEARHAIHGLGEEIGVHVPRFVQSFISTLGPVQGIMAGAFSGIAIFGLIQVLGEVPEAIGKITNALAGWDQEAQDRYKSLVDENKTYLDALEKTRDLQREIALVGLNPTQAL